MCNIIKRFTLDEKILLAIKYQVYTVIICMAYLPSAFIFKYSSLKSGWGGWIRTNGTRYQKALPYRLATPQSKSLFTLEIEKHQEAKIFINQCNKNSLKKYYKQHLFF